MDHVFVSYARPDHAYVDRLVAYLRAQDVEVWVGADARPGAEQPAATREGIDSCAAFVVVMSPAAERSARVRRQMRRARELNKMIFPLRLSGKVSFEVSRLRCEKVEGGGLPSREWVERVCAAGRPAATPPRAAPEPRPLDSSGPAVGRPGRGSPGRNADFPWDEFDPAAYWQHNYSVLREDDRSLLGLVRDYFGEVSPEYLLDGIDVGTGPNIYPALALIPWCKRITMVEFSARNVDWLTNEVRSYSPAWDPFWDLLRQHPHYQAVAAPRSALAAQAHIERGSVFELATGRWDIGTMFFVAESLSPRQSEFHSAVSRFLDALRPGAPFAAAFMEGSQGYTVGTRNFPAVAIDARDVRACFSGRTAELHVDWIGCNGGFLRAGYTGMLLARGLTRSGKAR